MIVLYKFGYANPIASRTAPHPTQKLHQQIATITDAQPEKWNLSRARPVACTYHITKVFNAPLRFVYGWCTDFREDDTRIAGSKNKRSILERTKQRVIYTIRYKSAGKTRTAVNIVTLRPPRAWYLDSRGDEDDEIGEYRLTRLGPRRTRLDMTFVERWKIRNYPPKAHYLKDLNEIWDKYTAALERDYEHRK